MTLKVVEPIEVTEAVLAASDIPEPDTSQGEVEWVNPDILKTFGSYLTQYHASCLAGDGFIYCVGDAGHVLKIDPETNSVINLGSYSGDYYSATLAGDGDIYCVGSSGVVLKIDVSEQSVSTFGSHSGSMIYYSSVMAGDGDIYCIGTPGDILKINTSNQTISTLGSHTGQYNSATLAEDGDIYCAGNTGLVLKIGVDDGIVTTFIGTNGSYYDSCLFGDGKIYFIGNAGRVMRVDTLTSRAETFGSHTGYYNSITLSENGDAYCVGGSGTVLLVSGLYQPGDRVIKTSTHQVYQCLTATNQDPEEGATEDAAATWIVVGPTNKWAMFDNLQNTKTINDTDFTVTLNPITYVNTLAVLGFSGVSSVRVEVDDTGGTTIYDKTFTASDFSAIYDHYTYVFYQIVSLKKLIVEDLPPLPNTTIRVTFSGSDMQIGELAFGFAVNIGTLVANGTKSDRFRYREQQYNEFGYPTGAAPIVVELNTYDVLVPKLTNPSIQKLLDGLTGKNTLWVGDIGSDQRMITYGFFERSPIPFNMPNDINYQITVRASV